ncbi:uncharacterized protein BROUX77_001051 [Berkeleyomyces rouxiae]|uniref:uncharacterized protein n=1 Tax=Berkeleyomyces rouxiae TaxID=2035830 RepID=UPI003B7DC1C6
MAGHDRRGSPPGYGIKPPYTRHITRALSVATAPGLPGSAAQARPMANGLAQAQQAPQNRDRTTRAMTQYESSVSS